MAKFKQLISFNTSKAGTTKYRCLVNVRQGFGIAAKWEYALLDWVNNLGKHADRDFPADCDVPVYFNWTGTVDGVRKNWGHIATRLRDGRIWTDGKYYANVDTLMANYLSSGSPSYLGWGESVNGKLVVERVIIPVSNSADEDMIKAGDEAQLRIVSSEVKGWDFGSVHNGSKDAVEMAAWKGKDYRKFIWEAWVEGQWYRDLKNKQADFYNTYINIIGDLSSRPTKAQLDEVNAKLAAEAEKVKKAEEALANAPKGGIDKATSDKINETNNIVKQIWDFLTSIFKR